MGDSPFVMQFDPRTIKHLGVRMYSTLPPAVAEIVANAYDADASIVSVELSEKDGMPSGITVSDDGDGLTLEDINEKFLVIGRNRRFSDGDEPSPKHGRKRIGKKGLGKLALFGLAQTITITTCRDGRRNTFVLDWEDLNNAQGDYRPVATEVDVATDESNGTIVDLTRLKRRSPFDAEALADSLSRLFVVDKTFNLEVVPADGGAAIRVDNDRRYKTLSIEFSWDLADNTLVPGSSPYAGKLSGELMTAKTPIAPSSGLRGIALFSRQKLVNAAEFFSASTSSHFYQYLTGWISVDFVDELDDDVIATNRQSLDWEHDEMADLRTFLTEIVKKVSVDWRAKKKEKKVKDLEEATGIDTEAWMETLPDGVRTSTNKIIETLRGEEAIEKFTPVIEALHDLVPEYPLLHWRHLHEQVRDRVKTYYMNKQYGDAASQAVQIYCELIRKLTGKTEDGMALVGGVFGRKPFADLPHLQLNSLGSESEKDIQEGQGHLSRGVVTGFRNPISHAPIDTAVPGIFSELDCLNVLSLVSYLVTRLDQVSVNEQS